MQSINDDEMKRTNSFFLEQLQLLQQLLALGQLGPVLCRSMPGIISILVVVIAVGIVVLVELCVCAASRFLCRLNGLVWRGRCGLA